jgi:two-component system chemotaxis sensor kinase CheA
VWLTVAPALDDLQLQLRGTFLEESFENLQRLETGLLALDQCGPHDAIVADIFRAAHSIKGAAGTFGFVRLAELAHAMETLLDETRSGLRPVTPALTALLLESVDSLRGTLDAAKAEREPDLPAHQALCARLTAAALERPPAVAAAASSPGAGFTIEFAPNEHLLRTGNDPVRLFRELARLGPLTARVDTGALPAWDQLDPEDCHLRWTLSLRTSAGQVEVAEIFAWVIGDCELNIAPLELPASGAGPSPAKATVPPARPSADTARRSDEGLGSIRVSVDKIDMLMNMVGELVITQSMLGELEGEGELDARRLGRIREGLSQLARNTRALQESVMRLRSIPIGVAFNRFPRLVHDLSRQLGKTIDLQITGETTELDKTVLEKLSDPLIHLVRNSLDHGIEPTEERRTAGKPEAGTLRLDAHHRGGDIIVEVSDDGRGLDTEKLLRRARERQLVGPDEVLSEAQIRNLIFAPGFSTAEQVTDLSGRGVGMDVVQRNVKALGGEITVDSTPGRGTRVQLRLPLTLAIIDGQVIRVGEHSYVLPLLSIVESVQIDTRRVNRLDGVQEIYRLRDEIIPIVDLRAALGTAAGPAQDADRLMVVVEGDGQSLGLLVDELQAQQQVVVKSLETNFGRVEGLAGATILGDGNVAFILDVAGLVGHLRRSEPQAGPAAA